MNFSKLSNEDLYQMCLRGDESAWGYVYNYVLVIARSPRWRLRDSAEDMAQHIVAHLLGKGIEQVREQKAFRGFIKKIAVNQILDSFKRYTPVMHSIDSSADEDGQPGFCPACSKAGPEEKTAAAELRRLFNRALGTLSSTCREVLDAYVDYKSGEHKNYQELAASMGRGVGTLSAQIKRCLDQLRAHREIRIWLEG